MALISQIRRNTWLLIVAIGLGMGGFLLMDMIQSDGSAFAPSNDVGTIDGRKISINEFQRVQEVRFGSTADPFARRDNLWEYFIQETILQNEAEALGMGVSKDEIVGLFGTKGQQYLSPVVYNFFGGPQGFNMQDVQSVLSNINQLDIMQRHTWRDLEDQVLVNELASKMNSLVAKAIYAPAFMAEENHLAKNRNFSFEFVAVPFSNIADDEVKVSDRDIQNYLSRNEALYGVDEETRSIEFVTFEVLPTAADSTFLMESITEKMMTLQTIQDDSIYVLNQYGTYSATYFTSEELSPVYGDTLFSMQTGDVFGPIMEEDNYTVVKLIDIKEIPDSVQARHILVSANDPMFNYESAMDLLNNLKDSLTAGTASFDSLALRHGSDGTAAFGGDLGMNARGAFVDEFENLIFFNAKPGELHILPTQFGLHLVEVTKRVSTGQTGVRYAKISEAIIPSQETQDEVYNDVIAFLGQNRNLETLRKTAADNRNVNLMSSTGLKRNDYIVSGLQPGESTRAMVKWAFSAKTGEVSPEIYTFDGMVGDELFRGSYVVAALTNITPSGLPRGDEARNMVELFVKNEKKAEKIIAKIGNATDLNSIASMFNVEVQTADGVTLSSGFVPGLGNEPKVLGAVSANDATKLTKAIKGNNGVYVARATNQGMATDATNIPELRRNLRTTMTGQVSSNLVPALMDNAKINDTRHRFY